MPHPHAIAEPIATFPSLYREFSPAPELAPYIDCYWTMTTHGDPGAASNRVLPDGCIDIIVDRGTSMRSIVAGAMREPIVTAIAGPARLLGIRFLPGGARMFLPLPMRELTDLSVPLHDLAPSLAVELEERLGEVGDDSLAITEIEKMLVKRLAGCSEGMAGRIVIEGVRLIRRSGGTVNVRDLEETLGTGRRQLERRFNEWVGLPPKLFSRILRFQRSAALIRRSPLLDPQELVLRGGYFDQAHLIREFRELAGLSPGGYAKEIAARVASVQWDFAERE